MIKQQMILLAESIALGSIMSGLLALVITVPLVIGWI